MNAKRWTQAAIVQLIVFGLLIACGDGQPEAVEVQVTRVVTETIVEEGEAIEVTRVVEVEMEAPVKEPAEEEPETLAATPAGTAVAAQPGAQPQPTSQQRLIIKDGNMTMVTQDTEAAVNTATQMVVDMGGYIINQAAYTDAQGYRFATMRLAVPVDRFEEAMRTLRALGDVTNESSSGTDVTDEYVDLNSRLTNLEATRDRFLTFLEEAETVEQTLRVNEELKAVEEEIAIIQGRMNYLRDRAAFSTIDLTLNPWIPTPTPTATATASPTPTATPLPTAETWRPGDTAEVAIVSLTNTAQNTADFTIYSAIVCGPWLLLFFLIGYLSWRVARRVKIVERRARSVERET